MTVQGDVRDPSVVAATLHEHATQAVIHVAGVKSVAESMTDPGRYFAVNTAGTVAVLEAMASAGVRHMILSSSAAVYGAHVEVPVSEEAVGEPESAYGESKLQAERWLLRFEQAHGISSFALRYFNAAGASADGRFGESWIGAVNLIPVALRALATNEPMAIFGDDWDTPDGTPIRDYIHVDDLADGHVAALQALCSGSPSTAINLGTGKGVSVREVLEAILRVTGRVVPAVTSRRRPGDVSAIWADVTRAHHLLGWTARRTLDDIVADAWRFHSAGQPGPTDERASKASLSAGPRPRDARTETNDSPA